MLNLSHQYLIDWSTAISMFVVILMFLALFESRYPKKRYLTSLIPFIVTWFGVNLFILFRFGIEIQGQYTFLTATIPSLLYFWIVAKDRGGRFFFTFCFVDTIMIWVMVTTGLIDYAVGSEGLVNFILRMIAFAVMLPLCFFYVRKHYLALLHTVSKGWWLFTAMTGLFYITLTVMGGIPTNLRLRPEDMPATIMVLILLPLVYATIVKTLRQQQEIFEVQERQNALELQSAMVEARTEEFLRMEEKIRIERHDLRHRFQAIYTMLQNDQIEDAITYIETSQDVLNETNMEHYCHHPVLDAVLVAYFQRAKDKGIRVDAQLTIPKTLPVPAADLSTVFANAIENMIHAVEHLPEEQRYIICKSVTTPRIMIEFCNPCPHPVPLDSNGLPIGNNPGHGLGSRSIIAFAEKYNVVYSFRMEDGFFRLQLAL